MRKFCFLLYVLLTLAALIYAKTGNVTLSANFFHAGMGLLIGLPVLLMLFSLAKPREKPPSGGEKP